MPDAEARALKQLPSPEALRNKILLKAKTNELASEEAEAARADLAEGVGDDDKYAELKKGHGHSNAAAALLPEEEGGSSASPTKQRNRKTSFNISRDNAMPHTGHSSPALRRGGADVERFHPELCALVALKGTPILTRATRRIMNTILNMNVALKGRSKLRPDYLPSYYLTLLLTILRPLEATARSLLGP